TLIVFLTTKTGHCSRFFCFRLAHVEAQSRRNQTTCSVSNGQSSSAPVSTLLNTGIRKPYSSTHSLLSATSSSSTNNPCSTNGITTASACSHKWQPKVPNSWHSGSIGEDSSKDYRRQF